MKDKSNDTPQPQTHVMGSEVEILQEQITSARQFVKRHPSLTLIDLAEFEAFLKVPESIRKAENKDTPSDHFRFGSELAWPEEN